MKTADIIIGQNLKAFRERHGFTQAQLAEYLGIVRESLSYYEQGSRSVPTAVLEKAATLFGVDEFDFYEENQDHHITNVSLAFRSDSMSAEDMAQMAAFQKVVKNYLHMQKVLGV